MQDLTELKNHIYQIMNYASHDASHIERVLSLSKRFTETENADPYVTSLIALLHDVDDYKFVGTENAKNLTYTRQILAEYKIEQDVQTTVLDGLRTIGYSKRLQGIIPETPEAKIVSDANMCDALGANGILRIQEYNNARNIPFFDPNDWPRENVSLKEYQSLTQSGVRHIFEKILRLKDCMLTEPGYQEARKREAITIDFLYHLFEETEEPKWTEYLNNFLARRKQKGK